MFRLCAALPLVACTCGRNLAAVDVVGWFFVAASGLRAYHLNSGFSLVSRAVPVDGFSILGIRNHEISRYSSRCLGSRKVGSAFKISPYR